METILYLLPLTGAQKATSQAVASESEHLLLPTNDRGGASSIPREWRERAAALLSYVPPEQLKTFPNPKWMQDQNAGVDPCLVPGVLPEDARLISAVGAYGPAVSKHMLAMFLATYKRLPVYRDQQRAHIWADFGSVGSLAGKAVLVASAGDIGRHSVRLARTLGVQWATGLCRGAGCLAEGFDEICGLGMLDGPPPQADVMVLALPHISETAGLMSKARLLVMRPGVVLLNAGRGSTVDYTALAEVLYPGRLLGAGSDATDSGPLPPGHPLQGASSLLLTPHTAGSYNHMEVMLERIKATSLDNLRRYVEGRMPRSRVC